jgi:hypothetical protein
MQTKDKLRTGSMSDTSDAERKVEIENRQDDGKFWIMVYPEKGFTNIGGLMIDGPKGKKVPLFTYIKVDRVEYEHYKAGAHNKRCKVFELLPGMSPRDIMVRGK